MGITGVQFPSDPIQNNLTYDSAKAAFEALPSVRVLFDNGAGNPNAGWPFPGFERSFARIPAPGTKGRTWYFGAGGALADKPAAKAGTNTFTWDAHARSHNDFSGDTAGGHDGLWTATPPYHWQQPPAGTGLSYVTEPLAADTTVLGAGYVKAWVESAARNVDLQVTISEVRPDGKETFVQGGWLRANERKLDARKSRPLEPVLSLRAKDVRPLPRGRFVPVTIPLYYEGHVYRAGSRIRVLLTAPNGDQPIWAFSQTAPRDKTQVSVAFSRTRPSQLTLPVVPGDAQGTSLPPCPGLRGEPCRDYVALRNR
jgi:predicted acyl esterase